MLSRGVEAALFIKFARFVTRGKSRNKRDEEIHSSREGDGWVVERFTGERIWNMQDSFSLFFFILPSWIPALLRHDAMSINA